ncbi:MAG: amidohydrolase family protein [Gemmatimonadota bacterium]|nr:amidohydrolase family protein [Gemmatimonadota bacterium]
MNSRVTLFLAARLAIATCWLAAGGRSPATAQVASAPSCDRSPILVENARIWPDVDLARDVLVLDGRIETIGLRGEVAAPADARAIDAGGATLLPGLIDSHTHLDVWPGPLPDDIEDVPGPELAALQTLASGVTTVRNHLSDMSVVPELARRSADDCMPTPRVIAGARGMLGGRPELDGRLMWGARDEADARAKVRQAAGLGDEWIPLHGLAAFRPEVLDAIVGESRALGLHILAEGTAIDAVWRALEIGARSIDYLDQTEAERYPADLIEAWVRRPRTVYSVPPIGYYTRVVAYAADPSAVRRPERIRWLPAGFGEALLDAQEAHFRELRANGLPPFFDGIPAKFAQLRAAGVPMVVGSDSGSGGQFHADAIWVELRAWRDLGVPVDEALRSATEIPADMLVRPEAGRIAAGARADLVLYTGDLAAGELGLEYVHTVIKGGVIHVANGEWRPSRPP